MHQSRTRLFAGMLMLATILLVWNQLAVAAIVPLSRPLEIATQDVSLWQMRVGILVVRPCDDCRPRLLRVNENTEFLVSGDPRPTATDTAAQRERFLEQASEPAGRDGMITLSLAPDSDTVLRMRLSPRPGGAR